MSGQQLVHDEQRGCRDKHTYPTEADANGYAAVAYQKRGHWLRAYECPSCGQWHLTHKNALPPPGKNWRPPAMSMRQMARERNKARGRRGRRM